MWYPAPVEVPAVGTPGNTRWRGRVRSPSFSRRFPTRRAARPSCSNGAGDAAASSRRFAVVPLAAWRGPARGAGGRTLAERCKGTRKTKKGGVPKPPPKGSPTLAELGDDRSLAGAARKLATMPKDKFEASNRRSPLRSQPSKWTSEVIGIAHKNAKRSVPRRSNQFIVGLRVHHWDRDATWST